MVEKKRYTADPEKHRAIARQSYHAHRSEINKRRKERRDLLRSTLGITPEPNAASRMAALRATPRRHLQQSWTQDLFVRIDSIIAADARSDHARKTWRWAVRLILTHAEKNGLAQHRDITPAWLAGFPPLTQDLRKEPIYRANFGRVLVRLGLWTQQDHELLVQNLAVFKRRRNHGRHSRGRRPAPSPPQELCRLVKELAYRCGLSAAEMQELRVTHIQSNGLQIPPKTEASKLARLVPFGEAWDELSKTSLDAYVTNEEPTDYLFFSRSPRDKSRPLSKMTLNGAVATLRTTIESLRNQHFEKDFDRVRSLQQARFHLRTVHQLENQHARNLIAGSHWHKGKANEAVTIPIPAAYLLVAMCASRLIPDDRGRITIPEGGKRFLITWCNMLGYEITIDWVRGFASQLGSSRQKALRILRLICILAFDFWFEGRRMKLPDIEDSTIPSTLKDLLDQLAATRAIVRDAANPEASWAGSLFEYGNRKRSFRIPLIEDMNHRAWHNQCQICWHSERERIERDISEVASKENRKKGYHLIASRYGVSVQSLAGHRGRKPPRSGRGETQRSHFSTGCLAPIARCPRRFFKQLPRLLALDITIYLVVLLEICQTGLPGVIVSPQWIEQNLGFRVDESAISVALNHLGSTGLINFRRDPKGFYTALHGR